MTDEMLALARENQKKAGVENIRIEGKQTAEWVLVDAGDIVIHIFQPETRAFYNLEKMWRAEHPAAPTEV